MDILYLSSCSMPDTGRHRGRNSEQNQTDPWSKQGYSWRIPGRTGRRDHACLVHSSSRTSVHSRCLINVQECMVPATWPSMREIMWSLAPVQLSKVSVIFSLHDVWSSGCPERWKNGYFVSCWQVRKFTKLAHEEVCRVKSAVCHVRLMVVLGWALPLIRGSNRGCNKFNTFSPRSDALLNCTRESKVMMILDFLKFYLVLVCDT